MELADIALGDGALLTGEVLSVLEREPVSLVEQVLEMLLLFRGPAVRQGV